jgi:ketosteroid isomerase-like protein
MRILSRGTPLVALALILLGCEVTPPEAAFLPEDRVAIERLAQEFAEGLLVEDWDGVAGLFRTDAVMMPPEGPPVEGRLAIRSALEAEVPGVELTGMSVVTEEVDGGAFIAYARGTYEQHFSASIPDGDVVWTEEGSWLTVLRKDGIEPEHAWGIHRHIWNSDLPAMPSELPDASPPGS